MQETKIFSKAAALEKLLKMNVTKTEINLRTKLISKYLLMKKLPQEILIWYQEKNYKQPNLIELTNLMQYEFTEKMIINITKIMIDKK